MNNTSWWRSIDELDSDQKSFIKLPPHGKHLLEGPPGSGKTNMLLLRAQFIAGTGEKNVLIVTFTNGLVDFIRSGICSKGLIEANQIRTFHSWAVEHILQHLGKRAVPKEAGFDDETRANVLNMVLEANQKLPTPKLYSAIFVDEAQDFSVQELESLLCLSDNVCICGDVRQSIYHKDGLAVEKSLGLTRHTLKRHFRIGQRIARVADRLLPPAEGFETLDATSNYNPKMQGESSAKMHVCEDRDGQFAQMLKLLHVQVDAFKGDKIGIFCGKRETLEEVRKQFDGTDLADLVCVHGIDEYAGFGTDHPIHVLTIHSAKGAEFRAVHIYGAEDLKHYPLNNRELGFTAITRAKTALNVYRTGDTNKPLDNAFAEPRHFELNDLFQSGGGE